MGTTRLSMPGADDHAAGVLAEMTRQILHPQAEVEIARDARMANVEACLLEVTSHRVVLAAPLPVADQAGEPRELVLLKAKRLAHFARGGAAAIGDDVGSHRRAQRAIALIDVLNDLFALVAGWQIEIDVRPLAAVLAEESLEEQFHANWIDGGDFERVADGGVGRRAATLDKNAVLLAVADDVPDDEKVSGKAELGDQLQARAEPVRGPCRADDRLAGEP